MRHGIILGGGGGGADTSVVTAAAGDVLLNKVIVGPDGEPLTGTMPENGAVAPSALAAGSSYTIPAGHHNGKGVVTAKDLASQTAANATPGKMLTGYNAWVNGNFVQGDMKLQGAVNASYNPSTSAQTYTIPAGYHNGSGKVTMKPILKKFITAKNGSGYMDFTMDNGNNNRLHQVVFNPGCNPLFIYGETESGRSTFFWSIHDGIVYAMYYGTNTHVVSGKANCSISSTSCKLPTYGEDGTTVWIWVYGY